ncbi:MAG: ABC transporter permease subunit [Pirellulaceae bacterium]
MPPRQRLLLLVLLAAAAMTALLAAVVLGVDERSREAAQQTLLVAGLSAAIATPLGALLAVLLAKTDVPGKGAAWATLATMLVVPLYLQAAAWDAGFGKLGWHSAAYGRLAQPLLSGAAAVVWIHAMAAIPWTTLIVGLGLYFVDPVEEEEALLAGGAAAVFWRLTLPRAGASVVAAALWVMIVAAGEMTVSNIYMVPNYAEAIYTGFALGRTTYDVTLGALPRLALTAICVLAGLLVVRRVASAADQTPQRPPLVFRLGRWRYPAALLVAAMLLVLAGVPLLDLVYQAGAVVRITEQEVVRGWSPGKFATVLLEAPSRNRRELLWTLLIGAASATAALAAALPLAWCARRNRWLGLAALLSAAVLLAIPGPLLGMLVNWPRPLSPLTAWLYDRTIFAPTLALTLRSLPVALLICWYALASVADDTLDAARSEGAGWLTRLLRVVAPQRLPALAAAWLAALAVGAGDFSSAILTIPPGIDTIPRLVFGMIHFGVTDQVAGVCLTFAAFYTLLGIAIFALLRLGRATREM